MPEKNAIIITSIASPNRVMKEIAARAPEHQFEFIIIGDTKSPENFELENARFYSVDEQKKLEFKLASKLPYRHYARKNLGYLIAMSENASLIVETDDDNIPESGFWNERKRYYRLPVLENGGWINVYQYFTDEKIWPRGFPLEYLNNEVPDRESLELKYVKSPVQQGLANENPDVDAVYRLTYPLPVRFQSFRLALGKGSWCPFNSQNTSWFKEAFPLMYLPSYCSFRMTDIWRSLIAQRIFWENDWYLLFHEPTVYQERNDHNLLKDFEDEIPGYLNNDRIRKTLEDLDLQRGAEYLGTNLVKCYESLVEMGLIGKDELPLVTSWVEDVSFYC